MKERERANYYQHTEVHYKYETDIQYLCQIIIVGQNIQEALRVGYCSKHCQQARVQ